MADTYNIEEGDFTKRGARWDGSGTNFGLFSANATKVELCFFTEDGQQETARIELPEHTNDVWHGYVHGIGPGQRYGYRVHGPYDPQQGHRFNPNKLLLDPYALSHFGELTRNPAIFGYVLESGDDLTFDERDSAPYVPKCIVADPNFDFNEARRRKHIRWDETSFYELHVKGFTKLRTDLPEHLRGTYPGLAQPQVIEYVKSLGVSSIELLPIQSFLDDDYLVEKGLVNYWGYNTIGFFAPETRYASDRANTLKEFKEMVARYHEAGIEVILDVVYNHTPEGNEKGPTLCFKGIDNHSYYKLVPDQPRYYINHTGTGNTFNVNHPRVLQLVMDSLRYWAEATEIDGFRFDLGSILGRETEEFAAEGGFTKACSQDPILLRSKLIAEPWDAGPSGYHVGDFPPGWSEWNDTFPKAVRDFWRGQGSPSELATRLTGSADFFNRAGRKPSASVNLLTSHDGFTIMDLVTYNEKHNEANGEGNADGNPDNRSWNCGVEGPTDNPEINKLRFRQAKNLLATLFLSQGTPLLVAGDERGRSQQGNNNAYCQDNEISWVNWTETEPSGQLHEFTQRLIQLRKDFPVLRRNRFYTGTYDDQLQLKDLMWINANGAEMNDDQWRDPLMKCFGMLLDGRCPRTSIPRTSDDTTVLLIFNGSEVDVSFKLPQACGGDKWSLLIDTNSSDLNSQKTRRAGEEISLESRSVSAFSLSPD